MLQIAPADVPLHTLELCNWAASESGDRGVIDGAKAMAMTAIDFFTDEALRDAVRIGFESREPAT